jgi:hypothetical protein
MTDGSLSTIGIVGLFLSIVVYLALLPNTVLNRMALISIRGGKIQSGRLIVNSFFGHGFLSGVWDSHGIMPSRREVLPYP